MGSEGFSMSFTATGGEAGEEKNVSTGEQPRGDVSVTAFIGYSMLANVAVVPSRRALSY